jgi:hypothetical protein
VKIWNGRKSNQDKGLGVRTALCNEEERSEKAGTVREPTVAAPSLKWQSCAAGSLLSGEAGAEVLKPAPNDYLQRWPVSKRVISSKADADHATPIER